MSAAEGDLLDAVHWAAKTDCDGVQGDAHAALAIAVKWRGRIEEASLLYSSAAKFYWRAGDRHSLTTVKLNRAWALNTLGQLDECRRHFQDVISASRLAGWTETELSARLGLGWAQARSGDVEASRKILLPAWRAARRMGRRRDEALALEYLSETWLLRGHLLKAEVALRCSRRVIAQDAVHGDIALELDVRDALLSMARGHVVRAAAQSRQAATRARSMGMPWEEAQALRFFAMASLEIGRKAQARRAFARARDLLQGIGEGLERAVVVAWINALDHPTRGGYLQGRPQILTAHAESGRGSEPTEESALDFWLNHPLLGPNPWLIRMSYRRRKRTAAERSSVASGGAGILLPLDAPRKDWSSEDACSHRLTRQQNETEATPESVSPLWGSLGLVTRSSTVREALRLAELVSDGAIPVLITGETGTGKDLVAQGIHHLSGRKGSYVPVNCAAARSELFVAELFGVRRGAYTGAIDDRKGLIEEAESGTSTRLVDARVAAATSRDLVALVDSGHYRLDLYERLAGTVIRVPSLRERLEDLELLIEHLWRRGHGPAGIAEIFTGCAIRSLASVPWRGNVRELKHLVDRTILHCSRYGPSKARSELLSWSESHRGSKREPEGSSDSPTPTHVRPKPSPQGEWDPVLLQDALRSAGGTITEAARLLGLSRAHAYRLYRKLREDGPSPSPPPPLRTSAPPLPGGSPA